MLNLSTSGAFMVLFSMLKCLMFFEVLVIDYGTESSGDGLTGFFL